MANKFKAHIVYKTSDGKRLPGASTITGVLAKPALIHWAWGLGIQGIDYKKFRDNLADIGTLAHYMILCLCKGETPDTSDYSNNQITLAENCVKKFKSWLAENPVEFLLVEKALVSDKYKFGGTFDSLCKRKDNGKILLIDYKTSKQIFGEHFLQLAGYNHLVEEKTEYKIDQNIILRIGRDDNEGFEIKARDNLNAEWELFKHCAEIYQLKKELKKVGRW